MLACLHSLRIYKCFANSRKMKWTKEKKLSIENQSLFSGLEFRFSIQNFIKARLLEVQCNNDPLLHGVFFFGKETPRTVRRNNVKCGEENSRRKKSTWRIVFSRFWMQMLQRPRQDQFCYFDFVQLSFISCLRKKFHFMIEFFYFLSWAARSVSERKRRSFHAD